MISTNNRDINDNGNDNGNDNNNQALKQAFTGGAVGIPVLMWDFVISLICRAAV